MLDNNAQDRHSIISKWQMQSHCESAIAGVKDWIPCRIWHNAGCKACTTFSEIAADAQLHCKFLVDGMFWQCRAACQSVSTVGCCLLADWQMHKCCCTATEMLNSVPYVVKMHTMFSQLSLSAVLYEFLLNLLPHSSDGDPCFTFSLSLLLFLYHLKA